MPEPSFHGVRLLSPPAPRRIIMPLPALGNKGWLIEEKGMFVLEEGPCTLRSLNTPHSGSSTTAALEIYDGVPDVHGHFPDEGLSREACLGNPLRWASRNGRRVVSHYPNPMGCWMYDIGLAHGLTVLHWGGESSVCTSTTIAWYPFKSIRSESRKTGEQLRTSGVPSVPPPPASLGQGTLIDLYAPASPGTLKRGISIETEGFFRLARRDCDFYSILVPNPGAWSSIEVCDGYNQPIWRMPSSFTGSFVNSIGLKNGLIVKVHAGRGGCAPFAHISWREGDRCLV